MQEGLQGPHPLLRLTSHVALPLDVGYRTIPVVSGTKDWSSWVLVLAIPNGSPRSVTKTPNLSCTQKNANRLVLP